MAKKVVAPIKKAAAVAKKAVRVKKPAVKKAAPVAKKAAPVAKKAVPVKKPVAKKAAPVAKKAVPVNKPVAKKAAPVVKKAAPVAKKAVPLKKPVVKIAAPVVKKAAPVAKKIVAPARVITPPAAKAAPTPTVAKKLAPAKKTPPAPSAPTLPPVKGENKDGIKYTKDFDVKFLAMQRKALLEARESLTRQAVRLEDEAFSLIDDEMGDVQFDDESGEGDTMVVERERDLALSAQARHDISEIDSALARITQGSYGYSRLSMKPIPRERLEVIPWSTELVEEKVGGLGRL